MCEKVGERVGGQGSHLTAPPTTSTLGDGSARRPTSSHSIARTLRAAWRKQTLERRREGRREMCDRVG